MSGDKHARILLGLRALRLLVAGTTYAEMGDKLGVSRSTVDRLLAALSGDGVEVTREPNPENARLVHLRVAHPEALRTLGMKP